MKDLARRNSPKAGMATMVATALAGTARDASAHESPKTPFTVPQTSIPILDSQAVFPVRRIYSGTPENVGPVVRGDVILGKPDRLPDLSIRIV